MNLFNNDVKVSQSQAPFQVVPRKKGKSQIPDTLQLPPAPRTHSNSKLFIQVSTFCSLQSKSFCIQAQL